MIQIIVRVYDGLFFSMSSREPSSTITLLEVLEDVAGPFYLVS